MSRSQKRDDRIWLAGIALVALALRTWRLSSLVPDVDDTFQAYYALKASGLRELARMVAQATTHGIFDPLLTWLAARVVPALTAFRLPPVLLGVGSVLVLHRLGRRLGGERTGLLAAGLLAVSMLHIEWCRRVNFYSSLVFFSLLSAETLLDAVERKGSAAFLPYLGVMLTFAYTHPYAWVLGGLEAAWTAAYHPKRLPWLAGCLAIAAAAYLPWHLATTNRLLDGQTFHWAEGQPWTPWAYAWQSLRSWGQGTEQTAVYLTGWPVRLATLSAVLYAALFLGGLRRLSQERSWSPGWVLVAACVPVGLTAVLFLDHHFSFFFRPRQTLFILPFYLLIAAHGLDGLRRWTGARPAALAALGALFLLLYSVDHVVQAAAFDTRSRMLLSLQRETSDRDVLVFFESETAQVILYQYDPAAFLRLLPPRLFHGVYALGTPDPLWASSENRRNRVFCLFDPTIELSETRRRWNEIAGAARSGARLVYLNLGYSPPGAPRPNKLLEEFMAYTGLRAAAMDSGT